MAASTGNEDPIAALFELADRVAEQGPKIRRMYVYTAVVIVVFLAILVYLLFVALRSSELFVGLALVTVVLGGAALTLLAESDRFYRSFSERHRRLRLLQFAEPTPKIRRDPPRFGGSPSTSHGRTRASPRCSSSTPGPSRSVTAGDRAGRPRSLASRSPPRRVSPTGGSRWAIPGSSCSPASVRTR